MEIQRDHLDKTIAGVVKYIGKFHIALIGKSTASASQQRARVIGCKPGQDSARESASGSESDASKVINESGTAAITASCTETVQGEFFIFVYQQEEKRLCICITL